MTMANVPVVPKSDKYQVRTISRGQRRFALITYSGSGIYRAEHIFGSSFVERLEADDRPDVSALFVQDAQGQSYPTNVYSHVGTTATTIGYSMASTVAAAGTAFFTVPARTTVEKHETVGIYGFQSTELIKPGLRKPSPAEEVIDSAIQELLDLGENWDEEDAEAISQETAEEAKRIANAFAGLAGVPFIGPSADGSIFLEWESGHGVSVGLFVEDGRFPRTAAVTIGERTSRVRLTWEKLRSLLDGLVSMERVSTAGL